MVAGDAPRDTRSTVTIAPGGSVRTSKPPVVGPDFANSMYWDTCAPAATATVIVRGSPEPRSTIVCVPCGTVSVAGVKPADFPSTSSGTPLGFDCTVNVPVGTARPLASARRRSMTIPPPVRAASAITATATCCQLARVSRLEAIDDFGIAAIGTGAIGANGIAAIGGGGVLAGNGWTIGAGVTVTGVETGVSTCAANGGAADSMTFGGAKGFVTAGAGGSAGIAAATGGFTATGAGVGAATGAGVTTGFTTAA